MNLLRNSKLNCKQSLITKFKGSLYDQIPVGIAKNFLFGIQFGGLGSRFYNKVRGLFSVDQILKSNAQGVWYINTIVLPDILEFAEQHKIKTILHVHELQQMYSILGEEHVKRLVNYPQLIIANSAASADVIRGYGRKGNIQIIYPPLSEELTIKKSFLDKRIELGIKDNIFVWVMCGTLDKNKNPFLFLEIATELKKFTSQFKMVWIGGRADDSDIDVQCELKVSELNLKNEVKFVGDVKEQFYDYFAMANGFLLTSQFESFSLTTLEALFLQLPVVANDCVGVKEILGSEFGYVVKQKNNAAEFAQKMFETMNIGVLNKAKLRSRALEFSLDKISANWNSVVEKYV